MIMRSKGRRTRIVTHGCGRSTVPASAGGVLPQQGLEFGDRPRLGSAAQELAGMLDHQLRQDAALTICQRPSMFAGVSSSFSTDRS